MISFMPVNSECFVSHCSRIAQSSKPDSYCKYHYYKSWQGKNPEDYSLTAPSESDRPKMNETECLVQGCNVPAASGGVCSSHYVAIRRGQRPAPKGANVRVADECALEGCNKASSANGLCHTHYSRWKFQGKPDIDTMKVDWAVKSECLVAGCERLSKTTKLQLCANHAAAVNTYGLSVESAVAIYAIKECQNSGCSNTDRLHIDHDHEAGVVRGVLCGNCNSALGLLGESKSRAHGLFDYVAADPRF